MTDDSSVHSGQAMMIMPGQVEFPPMAGAHRSSRPDPDTTRDAILDAASALFAERGYLATSVEDIAVAAHVPTGVVYTSFGGKQQLLEAVVGRFVEPGTEETVRLSPEEIAASIDPAAVIRDTVMPTALATEAFADFYDLIHRNGTMDGMVASGATAAEERMRRAADAARRPAPAELEALRVTAAEAAEVLAYFLGYLSWRRLIPISAGPTTPPRRGWRPDRRGAVDRGRVGPVS